ncbi:MAG TPA: FAD-dependent oxidoreductase, partial [Candidatus Acidoferrales bacterium]|nr:FAD-dependent oxidoreductase [Candidatus Acidoferrales bacterium]
MAHTLGLPGQRTTKCEQRIGEQRTANSEQRTGEQRTGEQRTASMSKGTTEVVVIGAGVAGLACAQALCQAGLRVRILEARNRIGGRVWTLHPSLINAPVELGAEFIHGLPREVWQIVERAALQTHELT